MVVNAWPGRAMDLNRDGEMIETLNGERVTLKTEAGVTVGLRPEGTGCKIAA